MSNIVRLTSGITLQDLNSGRVSWSEAYKSQIYEWLVNPCEVLIAQKNTDFHMAVWSLLLMFFEPHGKYLEGKKTKHNFTKAFNDFLDFLEIHSQLPQDLDKNSFSKKIYKINRCGLFHSLVISKEFLLDCINYNQYPIENNKIHGGWIINVEKFVELLKQYIEEYIEKLSSDELRRNNFETTFQLLVLKPINNYSK